MNKNQQVYSILAICASILLAGIIIAYKPGAYPDKPDFGFKFPTGVGTSFSLGGYTYEGTDPNAKTISLTGSGSATATANIAKVTLGVQTEDDSAAVAIEENDVYMNSIINAIKALGYTDENIKTVNYNVYPNYNWDIRAVVGYTVTNMIQIEVDNPDELGVLLDAASEAGANRVDGIRFELSPDLAEELKFNAYTAALEDAQAKADLIAETLDLTITGVQSVSESSYVPTRYYGGYEEAVLSYDGKATTPIFEGDLAITVNVHIVYLFS